MAIRNAKPIRFTPIGLSDTLDSTEVFPGAMGILQNLIPDPSTKNLWMCRPGATTMTSFGSFTAPGAGACLMVVGDRVYGLIASSRNPGYDEPFCYSISGNNFVTVSGVTSSNVPTTQSTTGDWIPPTMALVGTKLLVTHPGFNVTNGYFGWFDVSNPSAITWSSGNTSTNALPVPPSAVATFYGRAYYACNPTTGQPGLYWSDVLVPLTITTSTQILTFDDNRPLTALAGLPLENQLGGIIQALIVFKGQSNIYQVTGDASGTPSPLYKNSLNVATGTNAPRSVCSTTKGLAFMSPEGLRLIDFTARVSEPIGFGGTGVSVPFMYATSQSRIAAAANANVLRISVQNSLVVGQPYQEYWYDISREVWSGPHTSAATDIDVYGGDFIMFPQQVTGQLWRSASRQTSTSVYSENGTALSWVYRTSMMPDPGLESYMALGQTTLNVAWGSTSSNVSVSVGDENGSIYQTAALQGGGSTSLWGSMVWSSGLWFGASSALHPRVIQWTSPVVFRRIFLDARGASAGALKIGDIYGMTQALNYVGT